MLSENFDRFIQIIDNAEKIALFPHIYADGDALGSCGALGTFLKASGHDVTVLIQEPVEEKLSFLTRIAGIDYVLFDEEKNAADGTKYDLAIAVDTSTPDRLGTREKVFRAAKIQARIDHHAAGGDFTENTLLDPAWAATAEGVWLLLARMGFDCEAGRPGTLTEDVKKSVASCIYTALVTDTGCFAFSNVTAQTHRIAGRMLELAGNMSFVYHHVFEVKSMAYTRLMKTVYNKLEFPADGVASVALTQADFDEAGAGDSDAEGVANILRSIQGVHVGIFVKPDKVPGKYRVSLRSDDHCSVADVATVFGGGGHVCAAGCGFAARDDEAFSRKMEELIDAVKERLG